MHQLFKGPLLDRVARLKFFLGKTKSVEVLLLVRLAKISIREKIDAHTATTFELIKSKFKFKLKPEKEIIKTRSSSLMMTLEKLFFYLNFT
jgi:hypothetical protein